MNTISTDRLIELAEMDLAPTADEQHLLSENPFLRTKLDEIQALFDDIRSLPDPVENESRLQGILPAVRQAIQDRKDHRSFSPLERWQTLPNFATALASVILAFIVAFIFSGNGAPSNLPDYAEITLVDALANTSSSPSTSAVWEASLLPEINLFPNLDTETNGTSNEIYMDNSTFSLMDQATTLGIGEYEQLKKVMSDSEL